MTDKHGEWTKGPWDVVVDFRKKGDRTFVTAEAPGGRVIVCQAGFGHPPQTVRANAHLIAAAPELAEALRRLIILLLADPPDGTLSMESRRDAGHIAIDALAKAKTKAKTKAIYTGGMTLDSTLSTEPLSYLDEAAISNLVALLAPILTHHQGMAARGNEERARVAFRTFLDRARVR